MKMRKTVLIFFTLFFAFIAARFLSAREPSGDAAIWTHPSDFHFSNISILDFLRLRSESDRFSFFLDRRVDPDTPLSFEAEGVPLIEGVARAVESAGLSFVLFDTLIYVGPPDAGGELLLATALRESGRMFEANPAAERLTVPTVLKAPEFCEPRTVLDNAAKKVKFRWEGLDRMPFDCWRELNFPSLPTETVFSILLVGFNVTYELDAEKPTLKPVAFRRDASVERSYPAAMTEKIDFSSFSDCQKTEIAGTVRVSGPFREMARLEYALSKENIWRELTRVAELGSSPAASPAVSPTAEGGRVVSGEIRQQPLGGLFDYLKKTFGAEFLLDPSVERLGLSPESRISCRFKAANLKKASKIVADTLGVKFRVSENRVIFYVE